MSMMLIDQTKDAACKTAEADAIRAKTGGSTQIAYDFSNNKGFADAIDAIQTGGGGWSIDDIVVFNGITGDVVITKTSVRDYALAYCCGITGISAPNLTGIAPFCFSFMTGLQKISLPALQTANKKCMLNCTSLSSVSCPNLTTMTNDQFLENSAVTTLVFPKLTGDVYSASFRKNAHLLYFDAPATRIMQNAFNGCTSLSTIILRAASVCTLQNINALTNTHFASGKAGGTLYVPNNLISSYQSASNWSTILGYANNQIKSIESTHTDPNAPVDLTTHYIDGTLIPTS